MKVARRRAPSVRAGARGRAAKGAGPSHGRGPPHRRRQRAVAPLHERQGRVAPKLARWMPKVCRAGRQAGRQRRAINLLAATLGSCPAPHLLPSHRRQAAGAARRAAAPPARPLVHHLLGQRPRAVGGRELLEQAIRFLTDLQHRPGAGSGAGVGGWVNWSAAPAKGTVKPACAHPGLAHCHPCRPTCSILQVSALARARLAAPLTSKSVDCARSRNRSANEPCAERVWCRSSGVSGRLSTTRRTWPGGGEREWEREM